MLSHGLAQSLPLWPTIVWPVIFSSCLYAIVRMCKNTGHAQPTLPLDSSRTSDALVLYVFFPASAVTEVAAHAYMLSATGLWYLTIAIPVYVLGWILLPALLDAFRPAQYLLPATYLLFAGAFAVLVGLFDNTLMRALNSRLFEVLTGLPTPI